MRADSALPGGLPRIRRARGFRLYDVSGKRYLDLYQNAGAAILGHRSEGTVSAMKDALSRGLIHGFPSSYEGRLEKRLKEMFPAYACVRVYSCTHRGFEAASRFLGRRIDDDGILDPALDPLPRTAPAAALWRPFLPSLQRDLQADVLMPVLPRPQMSLSVICFRSAPPEDVPASDHIPAYVLAGMLRALKDLDRASPADPLLDAPVGWERRGPYIRPVFDPAGYAAVFRSFLGSGVLLSPSYRVPSILPGEVSPGEARLLTSLFGSHSGG